MSNLSDFLVGKGYGHKETLTASGTWNWANAGSPKKVFVRMIAGAGGNAESGAGSNGGVGGNSVWDTVPQVSTTTATGGNGSTTSSNATALSGMPNTSLGTAQALPKFNNNVLNSHYGTPNSSALSFNSNGFMGGYGELKEFEYSPTGNVSFTIGAGGTEGNTNVGIGNQGAIELYY